MESRQPRVYTARELEAAQTLATFHLVDIVFHPAGSQFQQPVHPIRFAPRNRGAAPSRQLHPVSGPGSMILPAGSGYFRNVNLTTGLSYVRMAGTPQARQVQLVTVSTALPAATALPRNANSTATSGQPHVHMAGNPHATPDNQVQRRPRYRYSCYLCHHVSLRIGCVANHIVNVHGYQRAQVDRARIEASGVQMG
ncbi:uncharacterized protein Z520_11036 [Fonsecaea multimorphosa CBS 102226]|uniref:Uncharacterized protein n=1 Tax=Fonsecaea multimorphosa CBS 102226 TaxID=1442371 RepID=A0A0D2JJ10_9EURO|nr:uncharacterized protein Z520_11036 [Fonsecaea multimorphosa CBS 102226]KIX93182.1 hypothetical protein Z520_11036 [Fonsecaea multimorphosa CBS 102226]OAL18420.1 hypothetical protein AYO22_10616 [Fonsecaea multimorphosa]